MKVLKQAQFNKYGKIPHFSITRRKELYAQSRGSVKSLQQVLSSQNIYTEAEKALSRKNSDFRKKLKHIGNFNHSLQYFKKRGQKLFHGKDGKYGHSTRLAVAYFQFKNRNKISVDGAFGEKSFEVLKSKILEQCEKSREKLKEQLEIKIPKKPLPGKKIFKKTVEPKIIVRKDKTEKTVKPKPKKVKNTVIDNFNKLPVIIPQKRINPVSKIILNNIIADSEKPVKPTKAPVTKPVVKPKPVKPKPKKAIDRQDKREIVVKKKIKKQEETLGNIEKKQQESIKKRDEFNRDLLELNKQEGFTVTIDQNNIPEISYTKNRITLKLKPVNIKYFKNPKENIWNNSSKVFIPFLDGENKNIYSNVYLNSKNKNYIIIKSRFSKILEQKNILNNNRFESNLQTSIGVSFLSYGGDLSHLEWGNINFNSTDIRLQEKNKNKDPLKIYNAWKSKKDIIFKSKYNNITLTFASKGTLKEVRKKDEIFNGIDSLAKTQNILDTLKKDYPQPLDKDTLYDTTNESLRDLPLIGWIFSPNLEEKISEYSEENIRLSKKIIKEIKEEKIVPSFENLTDKNLEKFWEYTENGQKKTYKMNAEDIKNFLLFVQGKFKINDEIFKKAWTPGLFEKSTPVLGDNGKTINSQKNKLEFKINNWNPLSSNLIFKNFKEFFDKLRTLSETKNLEDLLNSYRKSLKNNLKSQQLKKQLQKRLNIKKKEFSTPEYFQIAINLKEGEEQYLSRGRILLKIKGNTYIAFRNTTIWTNISRTEPNTFLKIKDKMVRLKNPKPVDNGWGFGGYHIYEKYNDKGYIDTKGKIMEKNGNGDFVEKKQFL